MSLDTLILYHTMGEHASGFGAFRGRPGRDVSVVGSRLSALEVDPHPEARPFALSPIRPFA